MIVTEKTTKIRRNYFNMPHDDDDEEAQERGIIETITKLINHDLKTLVPCLEDKYPKATDLKLESARDFVPLSLRCLLQHLLVGKDTHQKEARIGHTIVQAVRPRTVIVP